MAMVSTTRVAVGTTIRRGPPQRPGAWGSDWGSLSLGFQNTPAQILIMEKSVRKAAATAAATTHQAEEPTPASRRANLPMKPDIGGNPARLSAGTRKSTASTGA